MIQPWIPLPPLARRRALQIGLVAVLLLALSGAVQMFHTYQQSRGQAVQLQAAQADAAAREIEQALQGPAAALRDSGKFPWGAPGYGPERLRDELQRLLVLHTSLVEVRTHDPEGRLLAQVSRTAPDLLGPGRLPRRPGATQAAVAGPVRFGQPFFQGADPQVELRVAEVDAGRAEGGVRTTAVVHLRLVADTLTRVGERLGGRAWLVDAQDRLIVHPVQIEMLRQRRLDGRPDLRAARAARAAGRPLPTGQDSLDLEGRPTLNTVVELPETGWLLVLEQPRDTVMAPVLDTLQRTALLMGAAAVLAVLASLWQGRRLAAPILLLRRASARIASGDFSTPVALQTGDELELLADDLNAMARRLGSFYEQLEAQVTQRTEQLSQARDAAERASLAKTRFLAAASHDLRQPMHTIGLLVGVLRSRLAALEAAGGGESATAQVQTLVGRLGTSVEAMERLFNSLLDISRLDAGLVQPRLETFALHELLQRLASQFEPQAQAARLRLRVAPCCALVRSDLALLERCLVNLLGNALRYTPAGGQVLLGARRRGDGLAVQVLDTGPGVAPADQARIFEEFVRLGTPEAGTTQAGGSQGLGLGLAIVQRTAELLGHRLSLRSTPGRGACFELLLPRVQAHEVLPAGPALTPSVDRLRGAFVLVVDDDADNRQALEVLCQRWGALVACAGSANAALAELDRHLRPPDLVVTDLQLGPRAQPGLAAETDGLSLLPRLREATGEDTPALLLTADTSATTAARALALGVPVLHKPVGADRLLETLCLLLPPHVQDAPSNPPTATPPVSG
ncbi:ATP-binding protein [Ideonella livida]|uniref:histidine kinase n=1 Tax=Ideonella livida TaxID=2707176 RepID=A0A7C9PJ61_9BURK|nr:ATP-binding protein [Ideonella livida]NDY93009.1 hybrid sensor histidine kinase/response regulator [Ideonella livida]